MAANFKIFTHRNSDSLHLKLMGDFDGSSACEVINAMKKKNNRFQKIIIHTSCLENIHPFGRDTFQSNLGELSLQSEQVIFTGENAKQIAPESRMCL
jgi:hypothetical protein